MDKDLYPKSLWLAVMMRFVAYDRVGMIQCLIAVIVCWAATSLWLGPGHGQQLAVDGMTVLYKSSWYSLSGYLYVVTNLMAFKPMSISSFCEIKTPLSHPRFLAVLGAFDMHISSTTVSCVISSFHGLKRCGSVLLSAPRACITTWALVPWNKEAKRLFSSVPSMD